VRIQYTIRATIHKPSLRKKDDHARKSGDDQAALRLHATFVAIFLVVAHVAMIFGMLNPSLLMG
jgi:hypothetical protein